MELVEKRRCVIVAAGKTESDEILKKNIYYDDYIIAADAGYSKLKSAGITPHLIVGDFDSSDTPENDIETIVLSPIKDCTDTLYAVNEAVNRGFSEILIIGGLGGRIDHSVANFAVLAEFKQKGVNITLIDENHTVYCLKDEQRTVTYKDRYFSVFAVGGKAEITLKGFYYEVDNYELSPFSSIGVSNELTEDTANVIVSEGTVLIIEASKTV